MQEMHEHLHKNTIFKRNQLFSLACDFRIRWGQLFFAIQTNLSIPIGYIKRKIHMTENEKGYPIEFILCLPAAEWPAPPVLWRIILGGCHGDAWWTWQSLQCQCQTQTGNLSASGTAWCPCSWWWCHCAQPQTLLFKKCPRSVLWHESPAHVYMTLQSSRQELMMETLHCQDNTQTSTSELVVREDVQQKKTISQTCLSGIKLGTESLPHDCKKKN